MIHRTAFLFFIFVSFCFPQAVSYQNVSSTTDPSCASGQLCNIRAIPGATVSVCSGSGLGVANTAGTVVTSIAGPGFTGASGPIQIGSNTYQIQTVVSSTILVLAASAGMQTGVQYSTLSGCLSAPVTTYTNSGAGSPCPTTAQLVPVLGGSCSSTTDNQGNLNFWALPGQYYYYITNPASAGGQVIGPFPISVGSSAGCPLGRVCDANFPDLKTAVTNTAAGQTLYVTKGWSVTSPISVAGISLEMQPGAVITASGSIASIFAVGSSSVFKGPGIIDGNSSIPAFLQTGASVNGVYIDGPTIRNTGSAYAINLGNGAFSAQNITIKNTTFSSTGGVLIATTGGNVVCDNCNWLNTSTNDDFHAYNNCGAGSAVACGNIGDGQGGNVVVTNSSSYGNDRMFVEMQGLSNISIKNNKAAGFTPTGAGGTTVISVVDGNGGDVSGNQLTYGLGSGGQIHATISGGAANTCAVDAGGSYPSGGPAPVVFVQTRGIYTALPAFHLTLTGTAITGCSIDSAGAGLTAAPILVVYPGTSSGITGQTMIEFGQTGGSVHDNAIFGGFYGLFQASDGENNNYDHNMVWGAAVGFSCVECRGTTVDHNKLLNNTFDGIAAGGSNADLTGFKADHNQIMRGPLNGDGGVATFEGVGIASGTNSMVVQGQCEVDSNSIIQTGLTFTPAFHAIQLETTNPGCLFANNNAQSLSTAALGYLFYNDSGTGFSGAAGVSSNIGTNLASNLAGNPPPLSVPVSGNVAVGNTSSSPIDFVTGATGTMTCTAGAGAGTMSTIGACPGASLTYYPNTTFGGKLQVTAGTTPSTDATVVTIAFGHTFNTAPVCALTYGGASPDSNLPVIAMGTPTTSAVTLQAFATALTNATTYNWFLACTPGAGL